MNSLSNNSYKNTWCNPNVSNLIADTIMVTDFATNNVLMPPTDSSYTKGVIKINAKRYLNALDLSNTDSNIFVGSQAGSSSQTAASIRNTSIGSNSLDLLTTGNNNTAVGFNSLSANTTGNNNTAVGSNSLAINTTGIENTAIGVSVLTTNTTGGQNVGVGRQPLLLNTTGSGNVAIGNRALFSNTTGNSNIAIGLTANGNNTTADNNISIGTQCMNNNLTGTENVAIGTSSMFASTNGSSNVAIGSGSLVSNQANNNVAVGASCASAVTTGTSLVAVGRSACAAVTTGTQNTGVGFNTLSSLTTGTTNLALGANSGTALSGSDSNNVAIANVGVAGDNNIIRIGSSGSHTNMFLASVVNCGNSLNNTEGLRLLNNTASYSASLLNYYELTGNISISYTGAGVATTTTNKINRMGSCVTIYLEGFSVAFAAIARLNVAAGSIPVRFRPSTVQYLPVHVLNNATSTIGLVQLNTDGSMIFSQGVNAVDFTGAGNCGILQSSITYLI